PSPVTADLWWHLHPMWNAHVLAGGVAVESATGRVRLGLTFSRGDILLTRDPEFAGVAFEYGQIETGTAVRVRNRDDGVFTIASFIPERATPGAPRVRELQHRTSAAPGWTPAMYAIHDGTVADVHVEMVFPDDAEAEPAAAWPQPSVRALRAREAGVCAE